jgi:hypothetical protein
MATLEKMKHCEVCQNLTKNKRFCNRACSNKGSPRRKLIIRFCKKCDRKFTLNESRSKYCIQCRQKPNVGVFTLEHFANKNSGNHPSWKFAEVRAHCRYINRHLKKACQVCGYDMHVELAHIKALHAWPLTTTLNVVNAESNILVLCRNHHWEFDHGKLHLNEITPRHSGC